jgi:hypothetical protein
MIPKSSFSIWISFGRKNDLWCMYSHGFAVPVMDSNMASSKFNTISKESRVGSKPKDYMGEEN